MRTKLTFRRHRAAPGSVPSYLLPPGSGPVEFDPRLRRAADIVGQAACSIT
jgi:hypothetical protein